MKYSLRRLISCCLVLALLLPWLPMRVHAAEQGRLVLAAVTEEQVIIEPMYLTYDANATILTTLAQSGHHFEGLETGFISAIDGVGGNFSVLCDKGEFFLTAPAETVSTVYFTTATPSDVCFALLNTMADYRAADNGVQNDPAAQQAYRDALDALYDMTQAQQRQQALQTAMDRYAAYLRGETVTLHFDISQGTKAGVPVDAVFTDSFGRIHQEKRVREISLLPGTYTFDLCDGGRNHVRGSITVTEEQTLSAALPVGQWLANADLSIDSGESWNAVQREGDTYYVPDYAEGNLYPYLEPGEGVDTGACGVYLANSPDAPRRTWQSRQTVLSGLYLPNSMQGAEFALEVRRQDGAWEQYQTYPMHLIRVPTLAALRVSGDGTQLPLRFDPAVREYTVTTVSDTLRIEASALCEDSTVSINATAGTAADIPVTDGSVITVDTWHSNGQGTHYTITVRKAASAQVTLQKPKNCQVAVYNRTGAAIMPKSQTDASAVFALIPGEDYTYVATQDTYYHTSADFTAEDRLTISAAAPIRSDWLQALHIGPTKTVAYESDAAFSPAVHTGTYFVGSNQTAFGMMATLAEGASGCEITGHYCDYRSWEPAYGERTLQIPGDTFRTATAFLGVSGRGNTMRLEIGREKDSVRYYQEYILTAQRLLQLNDLSCASNDRQLPLSQKFDKNVLNYDVSLGQMLRTLTLNWKLLSTASGNDKDFTLTVTCGASVQQLDYTALEVEQVQSVPIALDPEQMEEKIFLRLEHDGAISQTYIVTVHKLPSVETVIQVSPPQTVICLTEEKTGGRIWPDAEGKYQLNRDVQYRYTATCYGYVSQTQTFVAGESNQTISITLEPAAENLRADLLQPGDWSSFRGNAENNAVTQAKTPITAENAVLNWANKLGSGMSGGGVGSPILVGGVLYTYANDTVMKVDKRTGAVLLSMPMARASSFSITPPAYGEGMLFVGLSNGGIQAFDAQTLQPLWLYEDALGGQPNCPITYRDGYLYTGFWNSETRQANFVCISVTDEDPTRGDEEKCAAWVYTGSGFYWAGAYVTDRFVLVTSDDAEIGYQKGHGEILSLDCRTGRLLDRQTASGLGDLRSSICYDADTDTCYFTSKGGDFYAIAVNPDGTFRADSQRSLHLRNGSDNPATPPMSTSTPVIYQGRAYIGVGGTAQFGAYCGHNITVIDLASWSIAYTVPTQGQPQTSGLLTTAYDDAVYVYFIDNASPGKLRVIRDTAGQTQPSYTTTEHYTTAGQTVSIETAYVLFTPHGEQAQYAICSPIADGEGNLYFKNDSGYLMCVGNAITKLTVAKQPEKTVYAVGEVFDPTGLQVLAHDASGAEWDVTPYTQFSTEPLTTQDTEFTLICSFGAHQQMYHDCDGRSGVTYQLPTATLDLTVCPGHQWDNGTVTIPPTAESEGEMTYACTLCGAMRTEAIPATGECTGGEDCPSHQFTDISPTDWYHKAVDYAVVNGLMFGVSETQFWPDATMTRAQLVTVLWRQAGMPKPTQKAAFTDLTAAWYQDAVTWAAENGIVYGMTQTSFQPNGTVTREQLATILRRYTSDYLQHDTDARQDFAAFEDGETVSGWAYASMQWAVAEGFISGNRNGGKLYLSPKNGATRAQVASVLMRYIQKMTSLQ